MTAAPAFDAQALIAGLRARDEKALEQAYRLTFGTEWGRQVLAHVLFEAGVGAERGPELRGKQRAWADGHAACAQRIMRRAGFDEASAAVMVLSDQLEGRDDEPGSRPRDDDRDHEPDLGD
jgi:hypothetical protein